MEGSPQRPHVKVVDFASALVALRLRLHRYDDTGRAADRLAHAALRGAAAGAALRGGLHLVSGLAGAVAGRRRRGGAPRPPAAALAADTARWAAFLGAFAAVFVATDEGIAALAGRRRTRAWRALAAGAAAGPTLLLTGPGERHTSLALYVLLRGATLLVRCGNLPSAPRARRAALAPTRWRHGDAALMVLSTAQLGYSWLVQPGSLPPSFVRFLDKHGGKGAAEYAAVREMCARAAAGAPPAGPLAALAGTRHAGFAGAVPCGFLHPGRSCGGHALAFLPGALLRALPVYVPVYVVPAALVHRGALLAPAAGALWGRVLAGAARSSLFLALYCALAWRGACGAFRAAGRTSGPVAAAGCCVAGLAVLAEKKSRRMELALYCASRAAESFALCVAAGGAAPRLRARLARLPAPRADVAMFAAAAAAICHCYSDHEGKRRDVFRSKYLSVFDFVLGSTGFEAASIAHVPSNADLAAAAGREGMRLARSMRSLSLAALGAGGLGGGGWGAAGRRAGADGDGGADDGGSTSGASSSGGSSPGGAPAPAEDGPAGESAAALVAKGVAAAEGAPPDDDAKPAERRRKGGTQFKRR